jgi:spore germination cell wall hydrolase CwlJ-like protein
MLCLALNVYHEARGEPLEGQKAVALVTMKRAAGDPKRVCDEVFRPRQFSWANPLTTAPSPQVRQRRAKRLMPTNTSAWLIAKQVAKRALAGTLPKVVGGADHYYNPTKVKRPPRWAKVYPEVAQIGNHVFHQSN